MTICIYCKTYKKTFNNREHVIPQAFGRFKPTNFILNDLVKKDKTVCDDCNAKLGAQLDQYLAKDTIEGYVDRIVHMKGRSAAPFKRRRIVIKVIEGPLKGVYVEPMQDGTIRPLPQIGLKKNDGAWDYFLIGTMANIAKEQYSTDENSLCAFSLSDEEAIDEFKKFGIKFNIKGEAEKPAEDPFVEISITIDRTIRRAIAKIAFNYFAYFNNNPSLLLENCFDEIREFVMDQNPKLDIKIENEAILFDEKGSNTRKLGHIITVGVGHYNNLIANVSLFNNLHYSVLISRSLPRNKFNVGFGHFFNINNQEILEIESGRIILPSVGIVIPTLWLPK